MSRGKATRGTNRLDRALARGADPRTAKLLALQRELRLTAKQCRFVEALAVDLEHNQTKAALAAGASRKSAHVTASKWLRLAKVQKYYYELTRAEESGRSEETRAAIAGLGEALAAITAHMRAKVGDFMTPIPGGGYVTDIDAIKSAPAGVIKGLKHDEAGDVELKLVDGLAAAKTLIAHYTETPLAGAGGNLKVGAIIGVLPLEMVTALWRAMALASGRAPALPTLTRVDGQ